MSSPSILLSELLSGFAEFDLSSDIEVTGITLDSRDVEPGFVYMAMQGAEADGHDYIVSAVDAGAVAVIAEQTVPSFDLARSILIIDAEIRQHYGELVKRFYDSPSDSLLMLAVTGTNGKTSVCHYLQQALNGLKKSTAAIGTLGFSHAGRVLPNPNTTPNAVLTNRFLAEVLAEGAQACAMEVSSHALSQCRVSGLRFQYSIFTNLTVDHLDYHGDMQSYFKAKSLLFTNDMTHCAIINADDGYGELLMEHCVRQSLEFFTFSLSNTSADLYLSGVELTASGSQALVHYKGEALPINLPLLGKFNLSNALSVLSVLLLEGYRLSDSLESIQGLEPVPGRMELVENNENVMAVVDYAHTPDALKSVLVTLIEYRVDNANVITVFGCGGDRDRSKRPMMAEVAERYSDSVVVTSDNPRTEMPQAIVDEIVKGFSVNDRKADVYVDLDRESAIHYAVNKSSPGDIVLVAGKGHEEYQLIGRDILEFSDKTVMTEALLYKSESRMGGVL